MGKIKVLTGKVLYSFLFVIVLPFFLILLAKHTRNVVALPLPGNPVYGFILLGAGIFLVLSGMWSLWKFGHGLPMNAFPPRDFVKTGIYAFTKHPIYSGAVLMSFGISMVTKSVSGFWLVSPLFFLMTVAYVIGFENERTETIFGKQDYRPFLSLPIASSDSPSLSERLSSYFLVFVPWLLVYETFIFIGVPEDAIATNLSFERNWPIWEFTESVYSLTYLFAILIPVVIKTKEHLRSFIIDLWLATFIGGFIYLIFPFIVEQKEFIPHSFLGRLIIFERAMDGEAGALPSFHVIWAFISALYFSRSLRRFRLLWFSLAVLISVSCITTGSHSLLDVVAGFSVFIIVVFRIQIWNYIRRQSEQLSNSWHEWRIGPVRIINHGFYGGAAGLTGTLLAGFFLGQQYAFAVFIVMVCVIIGSGIWAQLIEGSSKLLRPFGYYGGLFGGIIACIIISLFFSVNIYALLGAFAMAGPWIQSIGRLRCLVQGCCHGKPSDESIGIRFTHPYSRVNKISGLSGVPLHPTQLYSIASNIIAGLILIRLFKIGMPASFIIGVYFILNALGRFVEESFRGEAQTPYWAGMRIYQWIAIINILIGSLFLTVHESVVLSFNPNLTSLYLAIAVGILVTFASGIDFPESNRRFARLTSN